MKKKLIMQGGPVFPRDIFLYLMRYHLDSKSIKALSSTCKELRFPPGSVDRLKIIFNVFSDNVKQWHTLSDFYQCEQCKEYVTKNQKHRHACRTWKLGSKLCPHCCVIHSKRLDWHAQGHCTKRGKRGMIAFCRICNSFGHVSQKCPIVPVDVCENCMHVVYYGMRRVCYECDAFKKEIHKEMIQVRQFKEMECSMYDILPMDRMLTPPIKHSPMFKLRIVIYFKTSVRGFILVSSQGFVEFENLPIADRPRDLCMACAKLHCKLKCGRCHRVRYCSRYCQIHNWDIWHKYECLEL